MDNTHTCNDCRHRNGWRTEFMGRSPQKMVIADCMHPDWPEWWKARNARPVVMPGAGTKCQKYEQREPPTDSQGVRIRAALKGNSKGGEKA